MKILATGRAEPRTFASGPRLTAPQKVEPVRALAKGWLYDRVSVGHPGPVLHCRPAAQPHNLGTGWLGRDF